MSTRRRKSPQQQQENISRKQFEVFLEQHEWGTYDIFPDLGEDILVQIYEDGVSTGISFYVQLKSVDDIQKHTLKSGEISYSFEVKDLEHWEAQATVVILAVWDVQQKRGWWIWINDAIEYLSRNNSGWKSKKKVNVHIHQENEFSENSLKRLRKLLADLYYPIVSKGKELTIQAKFKFPKTSDGQAKYAELEKHFAKGDEVELSGEYIEAFEFPEWWNRLYGNEVNLPAMSLKIGPTKPSTFHPAQIEFISSAGEEKIPYVELWNIKQGDEELTLSNEPQNIPLKFIVVFNKANSQNKFSFNAKYSNLSNDELLQVLTIQKILSVEGVVRLTFLDFGNETTIRVPPNSFQEPSQSALDFVEKICFIQKNIGVKLHFPEDGSFTRADIEAADELVSIIQNGYYQQNNRIFTVGLQKEGIGLLLEKYSETSHLSFQLTTNESFVDILSQRINLGPMTQRIKGSWDVSLEEVKVWYEQADEEDTFVVRLIDVDLFEEFENWINAGKSKD